MTKDRLLTQDMMHELSWEIPGRLLALRLNGHYTIEEAEIVNQVITEKLNQADERLMLLVDGTNMKRPYNFEMIRSSQTYMNHKNLKMLFVIAEDKLIRLSLMVIYNLSKAQFVMADNQEHLQKLFQTFIRN